MADTDDAWKKEALASAVLQVVPVEVCGLPREWRLLSYRLVHCGLCYRRDLMKGETGWACPDGCDEPSDEEPWDDTFACSEHGVDFLLDRTQEWWCFSCEQEVWRAGTDPRAAMHYPNESEEVIAAAPVLSPEEQQKRYWWRQHLSYEDPAANQKYEHCWLQGVRDNDRAAFARADALLESWARAHGLLGPGGAAMLEAAGSDVRHAEIAGIVRIWRRNPHSVACCLSCQSRRFKRSKIGKHCTAAAAGTTTVTTSHKRPPSRVRCMASKYATRT